MTDPEETRSGPRATVVPGVVAGGLAIRVAQVRALVDLHPRSSGTAAAIVAAQAGQFVLGTAAPAAG